MKKKFKNKLLVLSMFFMLNIICCVNSTFADSYDGPSPSGDIAYIDAKDNYANIRKVAGVQYEIIDKLDNGTEVSVYGSIKNKKGEKWYCIEKNNRNKNYGKSKWGIDIYCGWTHESNIKFGEKLNN